MLWINKLALWSPQHEQRETAVSELGKSRDPRAVNALARALDDSYYSVRRAAAEALSTIGGDKAVSALAAHLPADDAAAALVRLGAPGLRALQRRLADAVESRDERVQCAVLSAVHYSTEPDRLEILSKALGTTATARRARILAATLVAKRTGHDTALASGDPEVAAILIRGCSDSDNEVKRVAADYLTRMASVPAELEGTVRSILGRAKGRTAESSDLQPNARAAQGLEKSSGAKEIRGVLVITRRPLTSEKTLLHKILEEQKAAGHSLLTNCVLTTRVGDPDDQLFAVAALHALGFSRIEVEHTKVSSFRASDGNDGKYYVVFDYSVGPSA